MRRARRPFSWSLRRACAVPALIFAMVCSYAVTTELLSASALLQWRDGRGPGVERTSNAPAWRSDYRDRFHGCVPAERWPRHRIPGSLVVVRRSNAVERMGVDEAYARSQNRNTADDVWVIGGCR